MAGNKKRPVITENFAVNLDQIRLFLGSDGRKAFEKLLDRLIEDIIPLICQYSQSGRSLLRRPVGSIEAGQLLRQLEGLLSAGEEVREFIVDDYIILYLVRKKEAAFLSIKHHRQLSYDLNKFWTGA